MRPMLRLALTTPLVLLVLQTSEPEPEPSADSPVEAVAEDACLPCGGSGHPGVAAVRANLEQAFALSLTVPDCDGADNLQSCRSMEKLLEETFETLDGVVAEGEAAGSIDCVSCDPRPHLSPLFTSFETVATVLVDRGYDEFVGKLARMQQEIQLWKGYSCCGVKTTRRRPNREMDARTVLIEKCGVNFEKNRSALKQVVRMPGDREGCFQSRACRDATQHNGQFMDAGFWTYDGEYWYIWGKRRTPRGDWIDCNP